MSHGYPEMPKEQPIGWPNREVGYHELTGAVIFLPANIMERKNAWRGAQYGIWCYLRDDGWNGTTEGWYVWDPAEHRLFVTRGDAEWSSDLQNREFPDLEVGLHEVTSILRSA